MLIVKVEEPEPPGTGLGTNAHVGGGVTTGVMLLHDRLTAPLKPLSAAMVIVEVADPPCAIAAGEGVEAAMVKSASGVTVRPTGVVWLNDPAVAVTVTLEVAAGVPAVVLIVKVEVAGDPPGVTGFGTNPQVAPVGKVKESQPRVTALLKPFEPVTVMVYVAGLPWTTV